MHINLSITEVHDLYRAWKLTRSSNFKEEAESRLSHKYHRFTIRPLPLQLLNYSGRGYQAVTTSFWRTFSWIKKQGCKVKVSTFKSIARLVGYSDTTVNSSYALTNNQKRRFLKACVVVVCERKSRENKQRFHWNLDQSRTQLQRDKNIAINWANMS